MDVAGFFNSRRRSMIVGAFSLALGACASTPTTDGAAGSTGALSGSSTIHEIGSLLADPPLLVTPTHVYFFHNRSTSADADGIRRIPRAGGPEDVVWSAGPRDSIGDVVFDGGDVFAVIHHHDGSDTSEIMRVPAEPGAIATSIHTGDLSPITTMAVDATHIYFTGDSQILRVSKSGGSAAEVIADQQETPIAVALDSDNVYWTTLGKGNPAVGCTPGEGQVHARPKAGGAVRDIATGENCPGWVGADSGRVYWRSAFGELNAVPAAGGAKATIARNVTSANAAFDASGVIFAAASSDGFALYKADKHTASATPFLATRSTDPSKFPSYVVTAADGDVFYLMLDRDVSTRTLVNLH